MSEYADHYARLGDLYRELGWVDGWYCPGNRDRHGWYNWKPAQGDYDGQSRTYALAREYADLRQRLNRVVYATTNYAPASWYAENWTRYRWIEPDDPDKDEYREWENESKPMPNYGDIMAFAPFADIDLEDDKKAARASGGLDTEPVERALREYIEAFAELAAGRQHVFVLDSVGGVYVMLAPTVTAPIGEALDRDDRALIMKDLMSRVDSWLTDARDRVNAAVPEVVDLFEPDLLNNKNRAYKAPMSVHSSLDAVVTPMDTANPAYAYTPMSAVTDREISRAFEWAEDFTADHREAVGPLVANLYGEDYSDDPDAWRSTVRDRVTNLKEKEEQRRREQQRRRERRENRDVDPSELEKTTNLDDVKDAVDQINPEDVVRDLCHAWDTAPSRSGPTRFEPGYRPSTSGTSCYVGTEKDVIVDLKADDTTIGVVDYVARETHWIGVGKENTATGRNWWRAVDELRRMGYPIPRLVDPQAGDMSEYYHYDLDSVAQRHGLPDPFEDADGLLRACLAAREENPDLEDAKPPYKALVALAEQFDLQMADPEEGILGKAGHKFALELFRELELADLDGSKVPAD